ncbi:MAG TPA: aldo/keto reductase [Steroidobacteraceae bacterium]|nr:aldo/keto reductase [Steroidobacteraceae bacterium]
MTQLKTRYINQVAVSELGFGCMNLNHAYEPRLSFDRAQDLLKAAFDAGVTHFDTAALYGFGVNEEWVGAGIKSFRSKIYLASKCGMTGINGKRVIDGKPETLKSTCEEALRRLQVDHIDLYYLHRWDKKVPIEESMGAMADLINKGWIGAIGLSEVSAATLRKAHAIHPVAAVQNEYSLWTRNAELGLLDACKELNIALVTFSPLGRGFLARDSRSGFDFLPSDLRRVMPRFQSPHLERNLLLLKRYEELALSAGCTPAQLALAWLLQRSPQVLPLFGTTSIEHLHENVQASSVMISSDVLRKAEEIFEHTKISGARYPLEALQEVDTEEFGGVVNTR